MVAIPAPHCHYHRHARPIFLIYSHWDKSALGRWRILHKTCYCVFSRSWAIINGNVYPIRIKHVFPFCWDPTLGRRVLPLGYGNNKTFLVLSYFSESKENGVGGSKIFFWLRDFQHTLVLCDWDFAIPNVFNRQCI